jgi:hypothetical protein
MGPQLITPELKKQLEAFLADKKKSDLLSTYLFFVEQRFKLKPILFPAGKVIYENVDQAIELLEKEGKLWHEAKIRISFAKEAVNEGTKKIYICPFCPKVYGDNTHPDPQDAIYEHVSSCLENNERLGGLKTKRFFVSEDPEVIKNYIHPPKEALTKVVYSSVVTGKLFNSRQAVVKDFKENHIKSLSVAEALGQNRFEIEKKFLSFLQDQLEDTKVSAFVEEASRHEEFTPHVERWVEVQEEA